MSFNLQLNQVFALIALTVNLLTSNSVKAVWKRTPYTSNIIQSSTFQNHKIRSTDRFYFYVGDDQRKFINYNMTTGPNAMMSIEVFNKVMLHPDFQKILHQHIYKDLNTGKIVDGKDLYNLSYGLLKDLNRRYFIEQYGIADTSSNDQDDKKKFTINSDNNVCVEDLHFLFEWMMNRTMQSFYFSWDSDQRNGYACRCNLK
ncbi:hypothetical protein GJ496_003319 [Pomphorhynchus laevis]|nr:hypothetical protein GJ496_003319 [Pomphorhynchus laevis]